MLHAAHNFYIEVQRTNDVSVLSLSSMLAPLPSSFLVIKFFVVWKDVSPDLFCAPGTFFTPLTYAVKEKKQSFAILMTLKVGFA